MPKLALSQTEKNDYISKILLWIDLILGLEKILMKISVIIPAYNAAETIADTLRSLLQQTFSQWEAIVVNDGSSDRTAEIVEEFTKKDSRTRLFSQENQGLSGARNSGVKLAQYDWMLFLDSDDWIFPQYLEKLTNRLLEDPSLDVVYCGWAYALPDGEHVLPSLPLYTGDLFVPLAQWCVSIVHTFVVRSSLVNALGCFNTSLRSCEDWLLWQRIARTGARFGTVNEVLAAYRTRPNSLSRNGLQLLKDGIIVLTQGHGPVEDLPSPHPVYPNGLPPEKLAPCKFYLLGACAGYLIGGGKDARPLLDLLEGEQCTHLVPHYVAESIVVHAMVSASKPRHQWRSVWQNCQTNLAAFLTALEAHSGTSGLASRAHAEAHLLLEKYVAKDDPAQQIGSVWPNLALLKRPISYSIYMQKQWIKRSLGTAILVSPLARDSAKQVRQWLAPKQVEESHPSHSPKEYFEDLFEEDPDPWNYTNAYEQLKYEQTLAMFPAEPINMALEIGCAEGHFTVQFAPKVGSLLATDVSQIALARSKERCAEHSNIQYQRLDLQADPIPGQFDLIMCSEMLYFMGDRPQLKAIARKLAEGLKPGGYLLTTHSNVLIDEPLGSGFEWGHAFGAKFIGETFASCPSLEFIHELQTPLYRIQLFQRRKQPTLLPIYSKSPKKLELLEASKYEHLPAYIAVGMRFGAATHLPILSYRGLATHGADVFSVTPEVFEAQLRHLRDNGYYSASVEQWGYSLMGCTPLKERAVTLLFENSDQSFLTYAWPLLQKYGFSATLMLYADEIGQIRAVDQGREISLVEWKEIRKLQAEGITFASHSASRCDLASLSLPKAWNEINRSRETLQQELATPISTFAYPYGHAPAWLQYLVAVCGYSFAITEREGLCSSQQSLLTLPRINVTNLDTPEVLETRLASLKKHS